MLRRFVELYQGTRAVSFESLAEYEQFTRGLNDNGISFKTKIIKNKQEPTKYYVLLIDEYDDLINKAGAWG